MAVTQIRLRRGNKTGLPLLGATSGEPLFCLDTKELYIGMGVITQSQYNAGQRATWASYGVFDLPDHDHAASQIIEEADLRFVSADEKDALMGIDFNIKDRINSLTNGIMWKGIADTFADIQTHFDFPEQNWAVIVEADETRSGQRSLYIYNETVGDWTYSGSFNITASALIDDAKPMVDKTYSSKHIEEALINKASVTHSHDAVYAKKEDLTNKANFFDETLLHEKDSLGSIKLDESNKGQGRTLLYDQSLNVLKFVDAPASAQISDGVVNGGTVWSSDKVNVELLKKSDKTHEHTDQYKKNEVNSIFDNYYNKGIIDSKIESAKSIVTGLKKEVVFVIPKVIVGAQKLEVLFPYKGKVKKIFANLPSDASLTHAIVADVEMLIPDDGWYRVDTVAILPGKTTAIKIVNDYVLDNSIIRIRIVSTPPVVISGLTIMLSVEIG